MACINHITDPEGCRHTNNNKLNKAMRVPACHCAKIAKNLLCCCVVVLLLLLGACAALLLCMLCAFCLLMLHGCALICFGCVDGCGGQAENCDWPLALQITEKLKPSSSCSSLLLSGCDPFTTLPMAPQHNIALQMEGLDALVLLVAFSPCCLKQG